MSENYRFWKGDKITSMTGNNIFVFGSNPQGRHGAGGAKTAISFGAIYGQGRGLMGNSYALVTKNLKAGFKEESTGIVYETEDYRSVSPEQISANINELYKCAIDNPDKKFFISYKVETWPNGKLRKSLNGYDSKEMWDMFTVNKNVPDNIRFHDSFRRFLTQDNKVSKEMKQNNQSENLRNKFTFFWQTHCEFSQWHPSIFKYKDIVFTSCEMFMMYSKSKLFKDDEVAQRILDINQSEHIYYDNDGNETHREDTVVKRFFNGEITREEIVKDKELKKEWSFFQKKIKDLGREVSNYNDKVWKEKRVPIVTVGNREKYTQNPSLMDKLMSTGDTIIVEASPYDKIWGNGLRENHKDATNPSKWPGLNLLGKVHTQLRNSWKPENKPEQKRNRPKM